MRERQNGFTLLELLLVTLIISLLAAMAVAKMSVTFNKARHKALIQYMTDEVRPGMTQYYIDHGAYPASGVGLLGIGLLDPTVVLKAEGYVTNTMTEKTVQLKMNTTWTYASGTTGVQGNSFWYAWCVLAPGTAGLDLPCSLMTESRLEESVNLLSPP